MPSPALPWHLGRALRALGSVEESRRRRDRAASPTAVARGFASIPLPSWGTPERSQVFCER